MWWQGEHFISPSEEQLAGGCLLLTIEELQEVCDVCLNNPTLFINSVASTRLDFWIWEGVGLLFFFFF